ncbi:MAG: UDP-N-acetylglucosamine--N-acetylmuramyl-(pentapeptide) pyrophosphoryl-undecaprenol N-acetylglucosamine transferase [Candidatus Magasanikbacteria bacterium]
MKVLFSGGYTLGPVTPLLAIRETIQEKYPEAEFLWVGTKTGPEKELIEETDTKFVSITSGKFRRYFSVFNIVDIIKVIVGFFQSIRILWHENPDMCISAGGFVSVPLHFAAWILGIPTWIHQQDIKIGLSNILMAPLASIVTTSVEKNVKHFSQKKTFWLGNPVRQDILHGDRKKAQEIFHLKPNLPVVFATGGGTGSAKVNQMVVEATQHLSGFVQIIHLSGKERPQELVERAKKHFLDYQVYQFFTKEMKEAYAIADIVVSRGGFGTLSEIAALGKVAIIIPKPGHQEDNVEFLEKNKAAIFVNEITSSGLQLAKIIRDLLVDKEDQKELATKLQALLPVAKKQTIIDIVEKLSKKV